jgi:hypothetical protein
MLTTRSASYSSRPPFVDYTRGPEIDFDDVIAAEQAYRCAELATELSRVAEGRAYRRWCFLFRYFRLHASADQRATHVAHLVATGALEIREAGTWGLEVLLHYHLGCENDGYVYYYPWASIRCAHCFEGTQAHCHIYRGPSLAEARHYFLLNHGRSFVVLAPMPGTLNETCRLCDD